MKQLKDDAVTHTPGPWTVRIGQDALVTCPDGRSFDIGDAIYHPDNIANARLIAAAPDLLAALKDVLSQFEAGAFLRNTDSDGCSDWALRAVEPLRVLAAASAAVKKAEGR
jgi:hypothetical protein